MSETGTTLRATLTAHAMVVRKKRPAKGGKPTVRSKFGDELCRKLNRWVFRELYADRENDHYRERVLDPETGRVIHECDEPLSQHREHGSAKKNTPKQA